MRQSTKHKAGAAARKVWSMNGDTTGMIFASFFLGLHVAVETNGIGVGKTSPDEIVDLLIDIARGEVTLIPSGADIRQRSPHAEDVSARCTTC